MDNKNLAEISLQITSKVSMEDQKKGHYNN